MKKTKNKLKTRKSVAKRFKITKAGKVIRRGAQNRHLKANRSRANTRRGNVPKQLKGRMAKKIKIMMGK